MAFLQILFDLDHLLLHILKHIWLNNHHVDEAIPMYGSPTLTTIQNLKQYHA